MTDDVLLARAFLSRVAEPACLPLWRELRQRGPVDLAADIRDGRVPDDLQRATASRARAIDPHADLDAARRHGIVLLTPESDGWPHAALSALESLAERRLHRPPSSRESEYVVPPVALWARGPLPAAGLGFRSVAIVGARASTAYGNRLANDMAHDLAKHDVDVVSGGAYGIDGAAHRGTLAADGRTVIVSAGGVDRAYPRGHEALFDTVAASGLILSETPPGTLPQRHRFLARNRLIAALSTGTVVVEAAARSGALNTAGHCRRLDRILMAVPGPVTSALSAGCHTLIADQRSPARLVTGTKDVLAQIGTVSEALAASGTAPNPPGPFDELDPAARMVLDAMPATRGVTVDRLTIISGLPVSDVLAALPMLELGGLIERCGGGQYRLIASPRTSARTSARSSSSPAGAAGG